MARPDLQPVRCSGLLAGVSCGRMHDIVGRRAHDAMILNSGDGCACLRFSSALLSTSALELVGIRAPHLSSPVL